jgi:hypothetical protein
MGHGAAIRQIVKAAKDNGCAFWNIAVHFGSWHIDRTNVATLNTAQVSVYAMITHHGK